MGTTLVSYLIRNNVPTISLKDRRFLKMRNKVKRRKIRPGRVVVLVIAVVAVVGGIIWALSMLLSSAPESPDTIPTESSAEDTSVVTTANETTTIDRTSAGTVATTRKTEGSTVTTAATGGYVQPAGSVWNLKLINKWNVYDEKYTQSLAAYPGGWQVDSHMVDDLTAIMAAGKKYNLRICSAFRTVKRQTELFERQVGRVKNANAGITQARAEEIASTSTARPYNSEHHLGLAIDFFFYDYTDIFEAYANTEAYEWMMENCAEYGFILRYPRDKMDITGVMFEPWHYRYVGKEVAREIMSRGLTLEEYLEEKGL